MPSPVSSHLRVNGTWVSCEVGDSCRERIHLPDMTPDEIEALPEVALYALLAIIDPPNLVDADGTMRWTTVGYKQNEPCRSYELPAVMAPDGGLAWYWFGQLNRGHDRPAVMKADGTRQWWTHGRLDRLDGPAVINVDGSVEYWVDGEPSTEPVGRLTND